MKYVYLLVDEDKNVVTIYDDATLAEKMLGPIEEKLKTKLVVEKRTVNLDMSLIGVYQ